MTRLKPEDLNLSALPRSRLGHLKTDEVKNLLQRAAWDYRETLAENQRLTKSVQELAERVEELTAQIASIEEATARRKDPDELARGLLASAQRAAREQRESSRLEAELVLKKAAQRAEKVEADVARREADRLSELARVEADHLSEIVRLDTLKDELLARLRQMLEALASRYEDALGGGTEQDERTAVRREK
jgi:cell division septum initiation protein DivIVA